MPNVNNTKMNSIAKDIKDILASITFYKDNCVLKLELDEEHLCYNEDGYRTLCLEIDKGQARLSVDSHPYQLAIHLTTDDKYIKWLTKNAYNLLQKSEEDWYDGTSSHYYDNVRLREEFFRYIKTLNEKVVKDMA